MRSAEYRNLFGRHASDSVLRKIAHAINGSLRRAGDFSARYDEARFAALIGSANEIQAQSLAESILPRRFVTCPSTIHILRSGGFLRFHSVLRRKFRAGTPPLHL